MTVVMAEILLNNRTIGNMGLDGLLRSSMGINRAQLVAVEAMGIADQLSADINPREGGCGPTLRIFLG